MGLLTPKEHWFATLYLSTSSSAFQLYQHTSALQQEKDDQSMMASIVQPWLKFSRSMQGMRVITNG